MASIREGVGQHTEWGMALRHEFHRHPELAYEEQWTSSRISKALTEAGVAHTGGWAGGTGIVGRISSRQAGATRTVALRADIDALPIQEETGVPYASETAGKMHACGHDGHISMLLMAARTLQAMPDLAQNVVLLFQPAEEGGAGAKRLVAEGALTGVDAAYGLHGWPTVPLGTITTRVGPFMAAATQFMITIRGRGGHAAYPHLGVDPIVIASQLVMALQTLVSRVTNPFEPVVVTVGEIRAGHAHNVIPDEATLHGTVRTFSDEIQSLLIERINDLAHGISEAHHANSTVEWAADPYPVTFNHSSAVERVRALMPEIQEEAFPSMAGEDFSFYGREVPACFLFLGLNPTETGEYPKLHTPYFDFNDQALVIGASALVRLGLDG